MAKYNTITDPNSDFKYGLLYGNFKSSTKRYEDEINSKPLIAQKIFEFAYENCIPISLGQTNPYGTCGVCEIYRKNISLPLLSRRLKSPYLFLLLGHSNVKDGNKKYIDKVVGYDWDSALGHTYYYRNAEKGYVINIRVTLSTMFTYIHNVKSAEDLSGINKPTSVRGLKGYLSNSKNPGNTFKFTNEWYLECAKYILDGITPDERGIYPDLTQYSYRFIDFLFKDYKREYKYENEYIRKYLGSTTNDDNTVNGSSSVFQGTDVFSSKSPSGIPSGATAIVADKTEVAPAPAQDPGNGKFFVSDGEIRIGEWNSNYIQVIEKGAAEHIPVVIFATAMGCALCADFKTKIAGTAKFKEWVSKSPYLFAYAFSGSGWWTSKEQRKIMELIGNGGLPRLSGYWVKPDGSVIGGKSVTICGAPVSAGIDFFIKYWDDMFAEYKVSDTGSKSLNAPVRDCDSKTRDRYMTGVWYGNVRPVSAPPPGENWNDGFQYGVPAVDSDVTEDLESIFSYAENTNTPLIILETNLRGSCNECNILHNQMLANSTDDSFNAWKAKSGCLWFVDTTFQTGTRRFEYLYSKLGFPVLKEGGSTVMFFYWKKNDGTTIKAPFWPSKLEASYGNFAKLASKEEFLDSTVAQKLVPPGYYEMRRQQPDLLNDMADQYYEAYRANFVYTPNEDGPARRIGVFVDAFLSDGGNMTVYRPDNSSFAVIATYNYAKPSAKNAMNYADPTNIEPIVLNHVPENNIYKYNTAAGGMTPYAQDILQKISDICAQDKCKFLYVLLTGHGGQSGHASGKTSYIRYISKNSDTGQANLTGKKLWEAVKDAKCRIFIMVHSCHAGGFFNNPSEPLSFAASEDEGAGSFIDDFIECANEAQPESQLKSFAGSSSTGPKLLMWSSNKSDEPGWMLDPEEETGDSAWWKACGGRVGTMLPNSFVDHYNPSRSYIDIWREMTKDGELCRLNQYNVVGSTMYTGKGVGPTPQYYVYGDFDVNEKIFTSDASYRSATADSQSSSDDGAYAISQNVTPGKWSSDFEAAKSYAIQNGLPFIAVWSLTSAQCHFCQIFEEMATSNYFMDWASEYKPVMAYVKASGWAGEISWVTGKDTSRQVSGAPGVRVYWEKDGKVLADEIFMGRGSKIGGTTGEALVNKVTSILGDLDTDELPPKDDEALLQQFIGSRDLGEILVTGRVRRDLSQCIEQAEQMGIPLVGIWSNELCSHCKRLVRAMSSIAFKTRMRKSGIVICYIFSSDGKGLVAKTDPEGERDGEGYHWCWGKGNSAIYKSINSFPFVRLYWKKDGKQIVDKTVTGNTVVGNIGTDTSNGTWSDDYGTYKTVIGQTANKAGSYAIDYIIKAFPGYNPGPPTKKGDGNVQNAILGAESGFITGQWYKYTGTTNTLKQFIDYANSSGLPVIFVTSAIGCSRCGDFMAKIQGNKQMIDWYANSGCLLLYMFSGSGWWTSGDLRLYIDVFQEGKGAETPTIGVWKQGSKIWWGTYSNQSVQTIQKQFEDVLK